MDDVMRYKQYPYVRGILCKILCTYNSTHINSFVYLFIYLFIYIYFLTDYLTRANKPVTVKQAFVFFPPPHLLFSHLPLPPPSVTIPLEPPLVAAERNIDVASPLFVHIRVKHPSFPASLHGSRLMSCAVSQSVSQWWPVCCVYSLPSSCPHTLALEIITILLYYFFLILVLSYVFFFLFRLS